MTLMNRFLGFIFLLGATLPASAQQLLTLDSCRAMALRNNKQLSIAKLKQEVAANLRRAARTKYLPHVSALGAYEHTSKQISLLNDDQKTRFPYLGTGLMTQLAGSQSAQALKSDLAQVGSLLTLMGIPAETVGQMVGSMGEHAAGLGATAAGSLNALGQEIVDAFNTDTRNIWTGSVMAIQPVFMGGSIIAMNRLADLNEQLEANSADAREQAIFYATDQVYWQVVSLKHKKRLAESYLQLLQKLDGDVQKMIAEGVATRSEGLSVSVKVSEAEMAVQKVDDGLTLSKMLLCQQIGLPTNEQVVLADENTDSLTAIEVVPAADVEQAMANRPELKMIETSVGMTRQITNILKAANMPQVALMGGYAVSNPSLFNGFEKKFSGMWNIGVLLRVPIWNWGDTKYKVRASKGATAIASMELQEAREKIELQVNQTAFHAQEANKRLAMAEKSISRANENLRTAQLGFAEGVISPTTVMEAQTAWLQAQSQHIDAQIDILLSAVNMKKVLGTLNIEN